MLSVDIDISKLWIEKFDDVANDILEHHHTHYIFPGGRGSTKSSFVGGRMVPLLLITNPDCHAVCYRRFGNTLKTSVYAQVLWGIQDLGLQDYFTCHVNPLEIIYKSTGQKILFLGMDDPGKVKSIKLPFGYIGITWWEELDQFDGELQIRKAQQSTMRGGEKFWNFMSFNPPVSINNWANEYTEQAEQHRQEDTLVVRTTYLDVPTEWLGQQFIEEAEYLQEVNPRAYENEYMGIPVGTGGNIFDNVEDLTMTNDFISSFDSIYNGLDWGFANDPNAFIKMHFDVTRRDLYIYGEHYQTHEVNGVLYEELYQKPGGIYRKNWIVDEKNGQEYSELIEIPLMDKNELITADSAEPKSIADFRAWGCFMRGAEKGADSVRYGIKYLQSLRHIYIDRRRCPNAYREFTRYEYERDKNNQIISVYPDKDNHTIDSVRYALERYYKRKGN
jgi:PBSX family phage terminase large subunit